MINSTYAPAPPDFVTWRLHNCDHRHRLPRTFLTCAIKSSRNRAGWITKNAFNITGEGDVAVIHRCYVPYSLVWDDKQRDVSYYSLQIRLFDNEDDAYDYWLQRDEVCTRPGGCSGTCAGMFDKIVTVRP